jgi:dipeptidyl aminopeptidase/acylaminoacyl peptidase
VPTPSRLPQSALALWAAFVLVLLQAPAAHAQGTRADYDRAAALPALTRGKVFRAGFRPRWLPGGTQFWYRVDLPGSKSETWLVDAATGKKAPFTPPADEKGTLTARPPAPGLRSRTTGEQTEITFANRTGGPVDLYWLDPEGQRREYGSVPAGESRRLRTYAGHTWLVTTAEGAPLAVFVAEERGGSAEITGPVRGQRVPEAPRRGGRTDSPDGKWRSFVREANVYLRSQQTNEELRLSENGSPEDAYSERQLYWSPDSRRLVALRTKKGGDRKVTIVESSPRDQLQPKVHTIDYLKPGDPIPQPKPHLFDIASRREIPVSDELFPTPWSVQGVRWDADSKRFTFLYNQRGHQVLRVIAVDAETGAARAIIDEQSPTFIDYAHKQYLRHLDRTGELLWMSERDGWSHLYLYNARTGAVKNQVTKGEWVVRGVDRVDEEKRQVWFRASGIYPKQDPYYIHYCRINFDGTGLVRLTEGDGTHTVEYSPDGKYLVDTYSRVDLPPVTELRSAEDGKLVSELERGDWSALLAAGWKAPERFVAKARDGKTDIYGVIFRPTNFDPARKYPIIEDIYAGPQGSFVPKAFQSFHGPQGLAELGFIVVKIDGMGTSNRSKAFHDVCWKNIGDAGLPDRVLWIQAAARKYPCMDLDRVGIYGTSAGGQNALGALLRHPEFYKVGVSACGCHDNRMDKIWWNELWMGWPLGPHYEEQSNVTQANRLQGKVLLIVGEMDTNVDPASTMQVVNALVKADKDFDLLVVPGAGHGMGGAYGQRRMHDYFVRHLLGVEPRR